MSGKKLFDNISNEQNFYELSEKDFYFQTDDRTWKSHIEDIDGGDNFADYCEEFFNMLEEEGYYD